MPGKRTIALAFAALMIVSIVGPTIALAQSGQGGAEDPLFVQGEPRLNVDAPDTTLVPGTTTELELQVSNDGRVSLGAPRNRDIVTAARNVRVEAEGEGPVEVETNRQSIGTVTEEEPRSVPIAVTVPEDAEPGEYELDVEMRYRFTSTVSQRSGVTNERSRTVTRSVDVEIDDSPRFEITSSTTDAQIGDRGVMEATVENIGNEPATDVRLSLESTSPKLGFGESNAESARAGSIDPGEEADVRFDIAVDSDASVREFAFDGTVQFTDSDGVTGVDEGLSTGVEPVAKQRFRFVDVESTLRVGEDGDIHGVVRNAGPTTANSVVVRFADESPNVVPIESAVAVGSLGPGEGGEFRLPVELTREAEAVPRNFDMAVAYRNEENERRLFEDVDVSVDVDPRRDEFLLDIEDAQLAAGSSALIDVSVTNNLDETVTDVEAKLFTDSPISSDDDEGYVPGLEPGESTTVTFRVSAASGATPRTYPLQMDFRYDDESGTSKVSDTYRAAIDVTEAEEDDVPWTLVAAAVVVIAVVGAVYWRRRG